MFFEAEFHADERPRRPLKAVPHLPVWGCGFQKRGNRFCQNWPKEFSALQQQSNAASPAVEARIKTRSEHSGRTQQGHITFGFYTGSGSHYLCGTEKPETFG
jgi:hypothetical protein